MPQECRKVRLGVIGGSGLYEIDGLQGAEWVGVESPFGDPSDKILLGNLEGLDVAFLPRHGRGHLIPPGDINFRANIDALKRTGVTDIISLSAVGSLREELAPGDFMIVDQFIDRTIRRDKSFFSNGLVVHVSMAHPVCRRISEHLMQATSGIADIRAVKGGTYLVMEGPQFSTLAESELYRTWGCDVIGMTNMPEAKLAREAEICYATVAMVTDYDCWHEEHDNVTVETVIQVVNDNATHARDLVISLAGSFATERGPCEGGCDRALENALMTSPEVRNSALLAKLDAIAGRVLQR
ncbi:MAG: S-methyl-5'-thioadenosine phosphorylase [Rhodospirillaceae bacterium]|nr:S-methyl-5'-thioadenosine phosphorylase [Rhodospirillaceae bacterium]